jgi:predicted CoA-binding protein
MEPYEILQQYRKVAIVGLSSNPGRPSHAVAAYLIRHGFEVTPVNPRETEVFGRQAYSTLRDVPPPLEIVDIFREAEAVPAIVEDAIAGGAKVVWMQSGIVNEEAARRAREAGLLVVMDRCIKVEHGRTPGSAS